MVWRDLNLLKKWHWLKGFQFIQNGVKQLWDQTIWAGGSVPLSFTKCWVWVNINNWIASLLGWMPEFPYHHRTTRKTCSLVTVVCLTQRKWPLVFPNRAPTWSLITICLSSIGVYHIFLQVEISYNNGTAMVFQWLPLQSQLPFGM